MAGQDYPKRLEAGATQNVNIAGDYVFCKFADRPFTVIMDGSRVTMEAGDKYRNSGGFTEFEIENTDLLNPIAIVLTIGQGDYERQIVRGEITVSPGVRTSSGEFVEDTRRELNFSVFLKNETFKEVQYGTPLSTMFSKSTGIDFNDWDELTGLTWDGSTLSGVGWTSTVAFSRVFYDENFNQVSRIDYTTTSGGGGLRVGNMNPFDFVFSGDQYMAIKPGNNSLALYFGTLNAGVNIATRIVSINHLDDRIAYGRIKEGFFYLYKDDGTNNLVMLRYDFTGALIDSTVLGSFAPSIGGYKWSQFTGYDPITDKLYLQASETAGGSTYGIVEVDQKTLQAVETLRLYTQVDDGRPQLKFAVDGGRAFVMISHLSPSPKAVIYSLLDYTEIPEIEVISAGCNSASQLIYKSSVAGFNSRASVSLSNGVAEGELIKALLEGYFKKTVNQDYMDSVFAFEWQNTVSGAPSEGFNVGSITAARAKITDDYKLPLPNVIKLTVSNTLGFI